MQHTSLKTCAGIFCMVLLTYTFTTACTRPKTETAENDLDTIPYTPIEDSLSIESDTEMESQQYGSLKKDSMERKIHQLAEIVSKYFNDSRTMADLNIMLARQKVVEKQLINGWEELSGNAESQDDGEIINNLVAVAEQYREGSTIDIITGNNMLTGIKNYQIAKYYNEVLKYEPRFREEIKKWSSLFDILHGYGCGHVMLEYWGGTIVGPLRGFLRNEILDARIEDMAAICNLYKGESTSNVCISEQYPSSLVEAVNLAFTKLDCNPYDDDSAKEYKELYQITKSEKDKIPSVLASWAKARSEIAQRGVLSEKQQNRVFNSYTGALEKKLATIFSDLE